MSQTTVQEDFGPRCQKALEFARQLYERNPDWVEFFREVMGIKGAARSLFSSHEEFVAFEQTDEHATIQQMVANLRHHKSSPNGGNEPTRVITVRLPESVHEALKAEAADHRTSMNKLCIAKLLQVLVEPDGAAARPSPDEPQRSVPMSPAHPVSSNNSHAPNPSAAFSSPPRF